MMSRGLTITGIAASLAGPVLHLIFLASIFDIHFKSPIVPVDDSHLGPPLFPAPARRLVLFVADGLRGQSFYQPEAAPWTKQAASRSGVLGLSHTRVPTESRPGHVALLAGLYEDPSAVTRGWSDNPVEFDHVLNRSRHSWAWGSPDIVPMFARGDGMKERVTHDAYTKEMEDFASDNISSLDTWVFDKVEKFFQSALEDTSLQLQLREDGNMFFLHLLGCDTNGHVHKPHSQQYRDNINSVDEGIRSTVSVVEKYFRHDGRTAYIMTADHGMTDWGSHGTGMDQETVTPLVIWGAGISQLAVSSGARNRFDSWPGLEAGPRLEVEQADLAPLMASLLGRPIPVNSMGRLPVSILDLHPNHKVEAMLGQVDQLLAQYLALQKIHSKVRLPNVFHHPYPNLSDSDIDWRKAEVRNVAKQGHFKEALRLSDSFIDTIMEGIEYYQRYQKSILLILIKMSFIGCAITNLAKLCSNGKKTNSGNAEMLSNATRY